MERITIFQKFTKAIGQRTLAQIIDAIRIGVYKKEINRIRRAIQKEDKEAADQMKKQLLGFTISGSFERGRRMEFLRQYYSYVILDIDQLSTDKITNVQSKLKSIGSALAGFISPSGRGYKVIVKTDAIQDNHRKAFDQVVDYYEQILDLEIDRSGKDITRLCFFSYDPGAFINEEASIFKIDSGSESIGNNLDPISVEYQNTFEECVQQMNKRLTYQVGNRNNYLFQLAGICNQAGLSETLVKTMVTQRFNGIKKVEMKKAITSSYKGYTNYSDIDDSSSISNHDLTDFKSKPPPSIPLKVYDKLPRLLSDGCAIFKDRYERDVFLTGAIGVLSGCLPNVKGVYDHKLCYPNLFAFVISPAGNGKGSLNYARQLGINYHNELLEESKVARERYDQEMIRYDIDFTKLRRKTISEQPKKPILEPTRMLFIPANSSSSMLIHQLKNNGDSGILFESESDTLGNVLKQDWGGYSDLLRKAAHHECISYSRKMNNEFVEIQNPRLSVILSGTPNQVIKLIPSVEDSLFSRFLFYFFDVQVEWRDVSSDGTGEDYDEYFEDQAKEVTEMNKFLEKHPTKINLTKAQWAILNATFREFLMSTNEAFGTGALSIVKRLGLILFRLAMMFTAMRKYEQQDTVKQIFCHDDDFYTALWLVEVYMEHALYIFDRLPQQGSSSFASLTEKKQRFYLKLPQKFHRQEALKIGGGMGMKPRTVDRHLRVYLKAFLNQIGKREIYEKNRR